MNKCMTAHTTNIVRDVSVAVKHSAHSYFFNIYFNKHFLKIKNFFKYIFKNYFTTLTTILIILLYREYLEGEIINVMHLKSFRQSTSLASK